jgi:hypothetical protein
MFFGAGPQRADGIGQASAFRAPARAMTFI